MYTYPAHRQWPMPSPSDATLTIFWDNQHEAGVLCMDNGGNIRGIHTASTLPHSRNRQHSLLQPHTASLRTPATNPQVRLIYDTAISHRHSPPPRYRRPNRRPNYACRRNQNETVALFCKVNAKRWCLQAEPSPQTGATIQAKAL